jgi:hypothetical protein
MATPSILPPLQIPSLQSLYWPILVKGIAQRPNYMGAPELEKVYHHALEDGRRLSSDINDAMLAVKKEQADIQKHIQHYISLIQTSVDSEFGKEERKFKLAGDVIAYTKVIYTYMQKSIALLQALQTNLTLLLALEKSILAMVQNNLNALANFMQQICNLGIPKLPSLPSLLGTSIFSFNGFTLSQFKAFIPNNISFAQFSNFSFSQCALIPSNSSAYVSPVTSTNFDGFQVGSNSGNIVPPLSGTLGDAALLANQQYQTLMQSTTNAVVYNPTTINPATILQGSLPTPSEIISNYSLPPAIYAANVLSAITVVPQLQQAIASGEGSEESKLLAQFVTLSSIVANNYDKNLTAAWLLYIQGARAGRSGSWLPNFEAAYQTYIVPSLTSLAANPVPWNTVLGGTGTLSAPTDIPLLDTLVALGPVASTNILWKLSYIEASLLGYPRTAQFDSGADNVYLSSFTGSNLDYVSTPLVLTNTQTVVLGAETASFPVSCPYPSAMATVLNQVIAVATNNIASNTTYQTNRPQFSYTYDAFANVSIVDRFTQFWRTFNYNLQALLAQDPYIVDFVATYEASLDSAIDPLGTPAAYLQIQSDALARIRSWLPGQPLLPFPTPPVVEIGPLPGISGTMTGWTSSNFNPQNFLDRPDVQSLPLSTQLAMLRTNESYASIMTTASDVQTAVATAQAEAAASLVGIQNNGFAVTSSVALPVNTNATPATPVSFDQTSYDMTGYVESPTLFEIQIAGIYIVSGMVMWDGGPAGVRTLTLVQNNTGVILDQEVTQNTTDGPVSQTINVIQQFNVGDTIQVLASQTTGVATDILAGSVLSVLLVPSVLATPQAPFTDTEPGGKPDMAVRTLPAGTTMIAGTAATIGAAQPWVALNPYALGVVVGDSNGNIQQVIIAGTSGATIPAFSPNLGNTTPNDGNVTWANVGIVQGSVFPIDPVNATTVPFLGGVVTDPVILGQLANIGTNYGSEYTVTGATFTPGGLVYAGTGGVLTQDYNALILVVKWVIVVGRAISNNTLLFQPQIPSTISL